MRWLSIVLLAACTPRPAPAVPRESIPTTADATECVLTTQSDDAPNEKRATIVHELELVDRELDAIDEEIAASAIPGPQSREEATLVAVARTTELERATPQQPPEDCPTLLARAASAWLDAQSADDKLAETLGARHPERIAAQRTIELRRADFDRQRDIELAETTAWHEELGKLPPAAPPIRVYQAGRRALRLTLATISDGIVVPSDAPAELRLAAARVADLAHAIDVGGRELGPKHPEMVRLHAEHAAALDRLRAAIASTIAAIDREIVELDHRRTPPPIAPKLLSRRAELAQRARELRRELDAH